MSLTKVTYSMIDGAPALATDFGVDPTGATNSTTALKAFFDYCIASGSPGRIPAGIYLVTAGVLAFDNGHVDTLWPQITTDGYEAVTFKRADATNAPMISITNGTASSGAGNFWQGGLLGGITFDQNGKATAANQHGLLLRGIVGTNFGHMRANDMGGSCIYIERKLYATNNPDPYNVGACTFEAAEANRCGGAAFYNDNYVGLTSNTIEYVRAIENQNGAFFGMGANNNIDRMSCGSCAGWSIGDNVDGLGGASSRFTLGVAEFDDMQYGINIKRVTASNFGSIRFVHRYNFGPLNPAGGYWPRICVQASVLYGTAGLQMQITDRIEAGGTKPDLGQLFDMDNAGGNLVNIIVQRRIIDNAGFGIVISDYYTNFNTNTKIYYSDANGDIILDTLGKSAVVARAPTTFAIPSGGLGTAPNVVQFSTEQFDPSFSYDPTTYTYTCRAYGVYNISARLTLALTIGTRLRVAVQLTASLDVTKVFYSTTANIETYELNTSLVLQAGETIRINADQNSGAPINLSATTSTNENQLFISPV
jgi:hypothetical protein